MKQICPQKICTGCGACVNVCPKQCIGLEYDGNGFLQPNINQEKCIECKKCQKVCPANVAVQKNNPQKAFVACSKNEDILRLSSSGGIFSELAQSVLDIGGIVCGAVFASDFLTVQHDMANNSDELAKMRGSKYIQSNTRNVYEKTKENLQNGKMVLFSGTPCQVAGLKTFLGKEYSNLITVDFICHGVASTKAYQEYLKSLNLQGKICDVSFRHKNTAKNQHSDSDFKVCFENGTCFTKQWASTSLIFAFANNLLSRLSCSTCNYSTVARVSDITIADYIADIDNEEMNKLNNSKSLILINTDIGADIYNKVKDNLQLHEISIEKAVSVSKHLSSAAIQHKNRNKFFKYLGKRKWDDLAKKYFTVYKPARTIKSIINKFKILNERYLK